MSGIIAISSTVVSSSSSSSCLRNKLYNYHLHARQGRYNYQHVAAIALLNSHGAPRMISYSSSFKEYYYLSSDRRILSSTSLRCKSNTKSDESTVRSATASSGPPSNSWRNWILGTLLSIILPFWKHKWAPLLILKREVDNVVEKFDTVIEIVEKVAEGVEKVADEVAEHLPEGGKLQQAVCMVEQVAKKVHEDAHVTDEFIHKVEDVENEIEKGVETIAEAIGDEEEENVEKQEEDKAVAVEEKKVEEEEKITVAEENVKSKKAGNINE